jgi:hypothetical protein
MATPDISLTKEEADILDGLLFEWDFLDDSAAKLNGERAAALTSSLLRRKGIPDVRLKYFTEAEYRRGRIKGSHHELFHRNGLRDHELMRHPHFLPYLKYFLFGPDLPKDAIQRFKEQVARCGQVTSGDVISLGKFARSETRALGLAPHEAAEEYFKLAIECGIWVSYAHAIRDAVKTIRKR